MESVRVAYVRYLNTAPLVEGLDKLPVLDLVPAAPSHIAGLLERNEADIGLVSLIDAARTPGLTLLPAGMIGCDGPTLTVRLCSATPIESIQRVHIDTESHTSDILCRVVLKEMHGIEPEFVEYDARELVAPSEPNAAHPPETILLIGDKVVTDAPSPDRYPYQLDLGEAWRDMTGLPFVYAVWMCRSQDKNTPAIQTAARLLDRQRRHNLTRLDWIVNTRARAAGWPEDTARNYLGSLLRYDITDRARAGAERFVELARTLGFADRGLEWADAPEAACPA